MNLNMNSRVEVVKLINVLKQNKDNHKKLYNEALAGFKEKARKELEAMLSKVDSTVPTNVLMSILAPVDMSDTYDTAIKMLEWSEDSSVLLDAVTFRNIVMDEWDWMPGWFASNARYSESVTLEGNQKRYIK